MVRAGEPLVPCAGERKAILSGEPSVIRLGEPLVPRSGERKATLSGEQSVVLAGDCPYRVGRGFLNNLGTFLDAQGHGRALVACDARVYELWDAKLAASMAEFSGVHRTVVLPAGESTKTLATVSLLHSHLLDLDADRHTAVVALGGGVVSDVVGLAASTFMRGLPLYLLPSTLLAMVDASIGGKNGVDLPQGKNLIGTFYLPRGVGSDLDLLSTLPSREWSNGLAEAVKTAIIGDPELFSLLENLDYSELVRGANEADGEAVCLSIVERSARVKGRIVAADMTERGQRAQLNLGHTLGHGLEAATHYQGLSHGEAVALGMLAAVRVAEARGILSEPLEERLTSMLRRWRLPVRIPASLPWDDVALALRRDKKRCEQKLMLVLPVKVGEVRCVAGAEEQWLHEAFDSLRC